MSLIRGLKCLRPCPKCLVPRTELSNLTKTHEIRTASQTSRILCEAATKNATDREDLLKAHGLRPVKVSGYKHILRRYITLTQYRGTEHIS